MKIFVDTNIFIDILLERKPFCDHSTLLYKLCENGVAEGYIAPITINNIYYICKKAHNLPLIKTFLAKISKDFTIAKMDETVIERVNRLPIADYEDALQYAMALQVGALYLVTRNLKDYKNVSHIRVCTPEALIEQLSS